MNFKRLTVVASMGLAGVLILTNAHADEHKRRRGRPAAHHSSHPAPRRHAAPHRPSRPSRPHGHPHAHGPTRPHGPARVHGPAPMSPSTPRAVIAPAPRTEHIVAPAHAAPPPAAGSLRVQNFGPRQAPPREQWGRGDWHRGLDVNVNVNINNGGWRPPALVVLTSPSYPLWYEPRPIVVNYYGPPIYYGGVSFMPGCSSRKSEGWDGYGWWHETQVETCYANYVIDTPSGTYRDPRGCVVTTSVGPYGPDWWRRQISRTCYFYAG